MQGISSFSLMMLPSLESSTASVSPSAFFFKNFLRPGLQKWSMGFTCTNAASCYYLSTETLVQQGKWWCLFSTFAELAVHKGSCCCKSLCCVLKFAEGLELDDLACVFWGAEVLVQILHRSSRLRTEAVATRCLAAALPLKLLSYCRIVALRAAGSSSQGVTDGCSAYLSLLQLALLQHLKQSIPSSGFEQQQHD